MRFAAEGPVAFAVSNSLNYARRHNGVVGAVATSVCPFEISRRPTPINRFSVGQTVCMVSAGVELSSTGHKLGRGSSELVGRQLAGQFDIFEKFFRQHACERVVRRLNWSVGQRFGCSWENRCRNRNWTCGWHDSFGTFRYSLNTCCCFGYET